MILLKEILNLWVIAGFVCGCLSFTTINKKMLISSWPIKILITLALGPFWWFMMPVIFFVARITK